MAPNLLVLHRSVEALRSHINYQIHSHRPKPVELGNTGGHSFYFLVIGKSRKGLEWFERSRNASALQVVVSNPPTYKRSLSKQPKRKMHFVDQTWIFSIQTTFSINPVTRSLRKGIRSLMGIGWSYPPFPSGNRQDGPFSDVKSI